MLTRSTSYTCATNNIYHLFLKERPSIERALFLFRQHAHISGEQNSDENKEEISNLSCFLTNCFFLSVESLFISSWSAFISSSLYWKSLTMNLGKQSSRQESGSLVHCSSRTFSLSWWCQSDRKSLTCSPWLCVWSHQQLSWREWHWTSHCHCLQTADWKKTWCQLFSSHILILELTRQYSFGVWKCFSSSGVGVNTSLTSMSEEPPSQPAFHMFSASRRTTPWGGKK